LRGALPFHPTRTVTEAHHNQRLSMADLIQIRQGFRANCNDLTLLVESEDRQWTLRVQESGRVLYTAGRANRAAAQSAGLEFAQFCGTQLPAGGVQWQAYW
jgi:hypothetical protein